MSFKGIIKTGTTFRITIDSAPTMPGTTAFALLWVPLPEAPVAQPIVGSVAPGARWQKSFTTPAAQMLVLDVDLPVDNISNISITIEENAKLVSSGLEVEDTEWTFLVLP